MYFVGKLKTSAFQPCKVDFCNMISISGDVSFPFHFMAKLPYARRRQNFLLCSIILMKTKMWKFCSSLFFRMCQKLHKKLSFEGPHQVSHRGTSIFLQFLQLELLKSWWINQTHKEAHWRQTVQMWNLQQNICKIWSSGCPPKEAHLKNYWIKIDTSPCHRRKFCRLSAHQS